MRPIIRNDVCLAPFNTFGIAARAKRFVRVESLDALRALADHPVWSGEPRLVLGGGSNVLFTRDFDGLVVHLATRGIEHLGDDGCAHLVAAAAGEPWDAFVRTTVARGWPGLENLALIPGSVGASPVQNIGAYGLELASRFAWLEALDVDDGTVRRMDAAACAFGYRDSVFKHALRGRVVITRVVFRLPGRWTPVAGYADVAAALATAAIDAPTPAQMVEVVTAIRRAKLPDPAVLGNAGSFFKNPVVPAERFASLRAVDPDLVGHPEADGRIKLAAGWMIDRCGWRGRSLAGSDGRAGVHDRQALVLVNRGGASGADVLALADAVRDSVVSRFGVALEPEPLIL
jgi:UDP-N-acetylmuramate dehydrogenase